MKTLKMTGLAFAMAAVMASCGNKEEKLGATDDITWGKNRRLVTN